MIRILRYGDIPDEEIFFRGDIKTDVEDTVAGIIADVRKRGDEALRELAERFDGGAPEQLEVTKKEIEEAFSSVDPKLIETMMKSAENIRKFHEKQVRAGFSIEDKENGIVLGQKITPVDRAGLYVPGGTASYPSTVLMDAIPASIAGCSEIVMATPAKSGRVSPVILAAAKIAGVTRIFRMGGAQAIAAMAYGTQSVPKVDVIVGPGNAFVTEAKRQVYGAVAIDMLAGPSEILVVSDGKSDPVCVAADMLSQAEHDTSASAVLVTDSKKLAEAVAEEIEKQLAVLPRREIARASVEGQGKIIVCDDLSTAIDISNRIAPEHLELCVDEPIQWLDRVRHAGSVFLGRDCPEVLGDYFAGTNHTLPTSGSARFASPLSVDSFVKKTQFTFYAPEAFRKVIGDIAGFARAEGLEGHARSAESRKTEEET